VLTLKVESGNLQWTAD